MIENGFCRVTLHCFLAALLFALGTGQVAEALDARLQISQYQKQHWQMEDGLPHNYVCTIARSPDGYLLVGTDEGLARFDGMRFTPFDLGPAVGLSKAWILSVLVSRDGSVWTGTFDGTLYRWRDGKLVARFDAGASVFDLLQDAQGQVWASTRDGVIRWNEQSNRFSPVSEYGRPPDTAWNVLAMQTDETVWVVSAKGLYRAEGTKAVLVARSGASYGEILSVRADGNGLLVGTSRGLYRAFPRTGVTVFEKLTGVPGPVVAILRDRDRNVWVGTWGQGLYRMNTRGVQSWSSRNGFADDFVRQLYQDADGNLWAGLRGGGLNRWKNPTLVPFGLSEGLAGDYASTTALDHKGRFWLGTWRGGLYRLEGQTLISQSIPVSTLFFTVRALAFDQAGHPWIGNWEGLTLLNGARSEHYAGSETPFHHISAILFDGKGRLWAGTSDNGIFVFDSGKPGREPVEHVLATKEVSSLIEANDGRVWVGTPNGAGWIDEREPGSFHESIETRSETFTGLSEDDRGQVWGCTLGGSLWRLNSREAKMLDRNRGLPGYPLYLAIDDGLGAMWISSPRGILRVKREAIERVLNGDASAIGFQLFNREDGMRTIECHRQSQPAGGRDADGRVWFPTSRGFVRIDPRDVRDQQATPAVRIEEVTKDGEVTQDRNLELPAGRHALQVRFTAFEFSSPEKLRFRYRMEGLESDWTSDGGSRIARYSRLPAGRYVFQVAAAIGNGPWSRPVTLGIVEKPEFYETKWFAVLIGGTTLLIAILIFRWQMSLFRQRYFAVTAERNRIAGEWHDTLLAGFSAISLQLEAAALDPSQISDRVREILTMTRKIVQHYRAEARRVIWDLHESDSDSGSFEQSITAALRQAADGRAVEYVVDVLGTQREAPKEIEHNLLRVCQEAVSNAVRHGEAKRIRVELRYEDEQLGMRVEDDGSGFDPASMRGLKNGHFGLTVMRERIQRFGGTFHLSSRPGEGTVVEANVPTRKR